MSPFLSLVLWLALGQTIPYVRSQVTPGDPQSHCLWWSPGFVTFNQSQAGNSQATSPTSPAGSEFPAITRAWMTWAALQDQCGSLVLGEGPRRPDRTIGYDPNNPANNFNLILFRTKYCFDPGVVPSGDPCVSAGTCNNAYDCWANSQGILALTTTTFSTDTGEIFDADIEVNSARHTFTTLDSPPCSSDTGNQSCVENDVQNTLTHEFGHTQGLAHSPSPLSTMYAQASIGELSKRDIDSGSQSFICTVYPQGLPSRDCVSEHITATSCSSIPGAPCLSAALGWLLLRAGKRKRIDPRRKLPVT